MGGFLANPAQPSPVQPSLASLPTSRGSGRNRALVACLYCTAARTVPELDPADGRWTHTLTHSLTLAHPPAAGRLGFRTPRASTQAGFQGVNVCVEGACYTHNALPLPIIISAYPSIQWEGYSTLLRVRRSLTYMAVVPLSPPPKSRLPPSPPLPSPPSNQINKAAYSQR